MNRTTII